MSRAVQIARLRQIGQLLLDARLAALHAAARARQDSEERLAGLRVPDPDPGALPEVPAHLASLRYQRWADARRAEINQTLARQTVVLIEAQSAARDAFGRVQALRGLNSARR